MRMNHFETGIKEQLRMDSKHKVEQRIFSLENALDGANERAGTRAHGHHSNWKYCL